jgi:hypothetical protein
MSNSKAPSAREGEDANETVSVAQQEAAAAAVAAAAAAAAARHPTSATKDQVR